MHAMSYLQDPDDVQKYFLGPRRKDVGSRVRIDKEGRTQGQQDLKQHLVKTR